MDKWLISKSKTVGFTEDEAANPSGMQHRIVPELNDCSQNDRTSKDDYPEEGSTGQSTSAMKRHILMDDNEEKSGAPISKKKRDVTCGTEQGIEKKKKNKNKFRSTWLTIPDFKDWLMKSTKEKDGHQLAYCSVCDKTITAHKNDIHRHSQSEKHIFNSKQISISQKLPEVMNSATPEAVRRAELKLSGFLAAHNLPFLLMDTLGPICTDLFPDSQIAKKLSIKRTKATTMVTSVLGETFQKALYAKIQVPGCFFSLILDETTDTSTKKQCAITIIYYDEEKSAIRTELLDMREMAAGDATSLYNCIKDCLTSNSVPPSNFVGFSSDTTSKMVGQHHSVFSLLKAEFPHIVCVKCSCHMIHLAASKACLKLPRSVEDLLRNLSSHFSRSCLRQEALKEFQIFYATEIYKILSPATTRWLSLQACVDRLLEQYVPLKEYLRETVFTDPSKTTDDMLQTMDNKFTRLYLEFMSYVLSLLNDFNTMFQAETSLLHKVNPETKTLLKTLCSNYMTATAVKAGDILTIQHTDANQLLSVEKIYIGIQASQTVSTLSIDDAVPKSHLQSFWKSCQKFYIELVTQIKKYFNFQEDIFDIISVVDPETAQSFEIRSLEPVLKRFPILNDVVDPQTLDNEWRQYAFLDHAKFQLDASKPAEEYWSKVSKLKNAAGVPLFKNLTKVMQLLLALPFSNVSAERVFSTLKNCKTDHRNSMKGETLVGCLVTKRGIENEGGCIKFNPTKEMLKATIWNK